MGFFERLVGFFASGRASLREAAGGSSGKPSPAGFCPVMRGRVMLSLGRAAGDAGEEGCQDGVKRLGEICLWELERLGALAKGACASEEGRVLMAGILELVESRADAMGGRDVDAGGVPRFSTYCGLDALLDATGLSNMDGCGVGSYGAGLVPEALAEECRREGLAIRAAVESFDSEARMLGGAALLLGAARAVAELGLDGLARAPELPPFITSERGLDIPDGASARDFLLGVWTVRSIYRRPGLAFWHDPATMAEQTGGLFAMALGMSPDKDAALEAREGFLSVFGRDGGSGWVMCPERGGPRLSETGVEAARALGVPEWAMSPRAEVPAERWLEEPLAKRLSKGPAGQWGEASEGLRAKVSAQAVRLWEAISEDSLSASYSDDPGCRSREQDDCSRRSRNLDCELAVLDAMARGMLPEGDPWRVADAGASARDAICKATGRGGGDAEGVSLGNVFYRGALAGMGIASGGLVGSFSGSDWKEAVVAAVEATAIGAVSAGGAVSRRRAVSV